MVLFFAVLFSVTACRSGRDEERSEDEPKVGVSALTEYDSEETQRETEHGTGEETGHETEQEAGHGTEIGTEQEEMEMKMKIKVGDNTFTATLADNSSVDALKELMADGPLTLDMSDYANMEKGADLGVTLPQNNEHMNTQAGDIILYQGRTFVIYYDTNSWSLTPIGKIDNVDAESLRAALGTGNVTVVLSLE